jgi:hypothetical protein
MLSSTNDDVASRINAANLHALKHIMFPRDNTTSLGSLPGVWFEMQSVILRPIDEIDAPPYPDFASLATSSRRPCRIYLPPAHAPPRSTHRRGCNDNPIVDAGILQRHDDDVVPSSSPWRTVVVPAISPWRGTRHGEDAPPPPNVDMYADSDDMVVFKILLGC